MLKKAGIVAAAAAGLTMLGSSASADPWCNPDPDHYLHGSGQYWTGGQYQQPYHQQGTQYQQLGVVNFSEDSDVLSNISALCNLDVNVLAVPVLQGNDSGPAVCANSDDNEHDVVHHTIEVDEDNEDD